MANPNRLQWVEQAKIDELQAEWERKGYQMFRNAPVGEFTADLVAMRGDQLVVFEVKSAESLRKVRPSVVQLADYIQRIPNATFRLVVANPPKSKSIQIPELERALLDYLIENHPAEVDALSTHTQVDSVDDLEIHDVEIRRDSVAASGTAVISIGLVYGSDSDRGDEGESIQHHSFPFEFELTLDRDLKVLDVQSIRVDTSSWGE